MELTTGALPKQQTLGSALAYNADRMRKLGMEGIGKIGERNMIQN